MFSPYRILLFSTLCCAYVLVFIQNAAITVLAPSVMRDLSLSPDAMGRLSSVYLCSYAVMQFFSGLVSARLGPHRLMSLQFAAAALGGFMFASAAGPALAMPGRAMNGLGMAGVMVSSFVLFGRWFPPSLFSRLCTAFFVAGGLGGFLATTPLALLCQAAGWRTCCLVLAAASAVLAAMLFFVVRDFPGNDAPKQAPALSPRTQMSELGTLFRRRELWRLLLLFLALASPYFAFHGLWGGVYLQEVHGLSPAQSGNVLAMGAVGLIAGAPFITWLSETCLHSHRRAFLFAGVLGAASFGALILFNESLPLWALYAASLGAGVASNGPNPIAYAAARALFGSDLMGTVGGLMASGLFAAGAVLQNISGIILDTARNCGLSSAESFAAAFLPMALLGLTAAALSFTLPETCGKTRKDKNAGAA